MNAENTAGQGTEAGGTGASAGAGPGPGPEIRAVCNQLSAAVTALHPLVARVSDAGVKGEILKSLFEITKQVEVIKKQVMRTERRDESRLL